MVTVKQSQVFKADGVTVICVHPGWVRSDMGGRGADLDPSVAAAAIAGVLNSVTIEHTGSFLNWDGTVHPW
jgi:NAD(P)-dependent dehydrogenase (short-subunit alcohol dehydrogenase family)